MSGTADEAGWGGAGRDGTGEHREVAGEMKGRVGTSDRKHVKEQYVMLHLGQVYRENCRLQLWCVRAPGERGRKG